MDNLNLIVEALVFASGRVVSAEEIRDSLTRLSGEPGPTDSEIDACVTVLNSEYDASSRAFRINRWGGGYRMATVAELAPYLQSLNEEGPRRLTRSLMETLSIIAYRQPVTKPEIDTIRGVDSNYGLRKLMELGFVSMTGRSEAVGRPLLFGTTNRFLEEFGLLSLDELPKLREAEELFQDDQLLALRREAGIDDVQDENETPESDEQQKEHQEAIQSEDRQEDRKHEA
ncbi:SMC-Scp complex subunit ScpB [Bacteroidota bacterium]